MGGGTSVGGGASVGVPPAGWVGAGVAVEPSSSVVSPPHATRGIRDQAHKELFQRGFQIMCTLHPGVAATRHPGILKFPTSSVLVLPGRVHSIPDTFRQILLRAAFTSCGKYQPDTNTIIGMVPGRASPLGPAPQCCRDLIGVRHPPSHHTLQNRARRGYWRLRRWRRPTPHPHQDRRPT